MGEPVCGPHAAVLTPRNFWTCYVYHADHKQWTELAALFAPDGTFTPHNVDGTVAIHMAGRQDIATSIAASVGPDAIVIHHLFSDEIDVDSAASAHAVWAMEDLITRPASTDASGTAQFTAMHGFGHYRPRFTKVDNRWYLSELVLDDLRSRLKATRFAPDLDNDDQTYGLSTEYLKPLVRYWADGFDWRAVENELNSFTHHRVDVGGTPVHFIREPGTGPAPIPLLLLHGWPWTFWDWSKIIRPLADPAAFGGDPADSFDVIVASLPGFAFSTPLTNGKENYLSGSTRT